MKTEPLKNNQLSWKNPATFYAKPCFTDEINIAISIGTVREMCSP